MDLKDIRENIDKVDKQMVVLFEERMKLGKQVAEYKKGTGKPIYDKQREDEKISTLIPYASNDFNKKAIEELFLELMSISRKYQYSLLGDRENSMGNQFEAVDKLSLSSTTKIVYYGVAETFAKQCINEFFGKTTPSFGVNNLIDLMAALENKEAAYGVIPVDNLSFNSAEGVYELLCKHDDLCMVGEGIINGEISTSYIILTKGKKFCKGADKIRVGFSLPHKSGALYHMLSNFTFQNLNITNMESCPNSKRQGEYKFLIDFLGNLNDLPVQQVLKALGEETIHFKIIGNYETIKSGMELA